MVGVVSEVEYTEPLPVILEPPVAVTLPSKVAEVAVMFVGGVVLVTVGVVRDAAVVPEITNVLFLKVLVDALAAQPKTLTFKVCPELTTIDGELVNCVVLEVFANPITSDPSCVEVEKLFKE
jgi:hypothetical protein